MEGAVLTGTLEIRLKENNTLAFAFNLPSSWPLSVSMCLARPRSPGHTAGSRGLRGKWAVSSQGSVRMRGVVDQERKGDKGGSMWKKWTEKGRTEKECQRLGVSLCCFVCTAAQHTIMVLPALRWLDRLLSRSIIASIIDEVNISHAGLQSNMREERHWFYWRRYQWGRNGHLKGKIN